MYDTVEYNCKHGTTLFKLFTTLMALEVGFLISTGIAFIKEYFVDRMPINQYETEFMQGFVDGYFQGCYYSGYQVKPNTKDNNALNYCIIDIEQMEDYSKKDINATARGESYSTGFELGTKIGTNKGQKIKCVETGKSEHCGNNLKLLEFEIPYVKNITSLKNIMSDRGYFVVKKSMLLYLAASFSTFLFVLYVAFLGIWACVNYLL